MRNRAASALRLLGLAGATLVVAGCGVFSPVQTEYSFIPADGVDLSVPGLELRNIAVVTEASGSPGVLVGQAINDGAEAVQVQFGLAGTAGGQTSVPAYSGAALSDPANPVTVGAVPVPPGSMVELTVLTQEAGQNVVRVPVLAPDRYYSDIQLPEASPSASPSPEATASPEASPAPEASEAPEG